MLSVCRRLLWWWPNFLPIVLACWHHHLVRFACLQLPLRSASANSSKYSHFVITQSMALVLSYSGQPFRALQFLTVWGTGEKGAEAWWSQGCRTLDDLRARSDLSAQQVGTAISQMCSLSDADPLSTLAWNQQSISTQGG